MLKFDLLAIFTVKCNDCIFLHFLFLLHPTDNTLVVQCQLVQG